ncbi:hypothetical protein [Nostoc sp. FACHB-110]|uniref:hypothetical protein n=1 Tax=Nostoc sp. FACHB-110 TaxID=2692834 RepID=UPI0016850764|nr:hypothetical protein [Nostoc sp. FACHB-110]MBD2440565.1 hypothetical protein [Nostoc sp. FACHB-110]
MVQRQEFLNSLSDNEVSASLAACFLEDKPDYSPEEVALFQECRSLIEAGCTYEEVTKHFSNKNSTTPVIEESTSTTKPRKNKSKKDEPEKQPLDISGDVGAITIASETELANLVDKITDKLVEKIPPGFVKQMYVQKAVAKLAESPEEIHEFFVQLEDKIMGQLEGKSPMQMMLERGRTKLLPHSSTKSIQLPPESENDTNIS